MRLAKCLAVAAFAATAFIALSPASARIGVVMMHGNGSWGGQFAPMVPIMAAAGYGFETPDMCWADIRQYDHTAEDCMADVDKAIDRLKAKGYDQIVVGGHSMGGINTLLYAANHKGLAGVIVFAPSSRPSRTNSDFWSSTPAVWSPRASATSASTFQPTASIPCTCRPAHGCRSSGRRARFTTTNSCPS